MHNDQVQPQKIINHWIHGNFGSFSRFLASCCKLTSWLIRNKDHYPLMIRRYQWFIKFLEPILSKDITAAFLRNFDMFCWKLTCFFFLLSIIHIFLKKRRCAYTFITCCGNIQWNGCMAQPFYSINIANSFFKFW